MVNQFPGNFRSKTPSCRKIKSVFRDVKLCFNAPWGIKGLTLSLQSATIVIPDPFDEPFKSQLLGKKCVYLNSNICTYLVSYHTNTSNFQTHEFVDRGSETQLHVCENLDDLI